MLHIRIWWGTTEQSGHCYRLACMVKFTTGHIGKYAEGMVLNIFSGHLSTASSSFFSELSGIPANKIDFLYQSNVVRGDQHLRFLGYVIFKRILTLF